MPPDPPVPRLEQVAAFFERRHTRLVALVFTDLVDSTALLRELGDQAGANFLQQRRQLIRQVLATCSEGEEIETAGDSFLLAFAKPSDAVRFALQVQARLRGFSAASALPVQERIGIHLGEVVIAEHETEAKAKDLYGIQLATCTRVMALAVGGQILLTHGVFDSARQMLKGEDIPGIGPLSWASHGPYLLKGIEEPVEVCEVGEAGARAFEPPKTSEKAQRQVRPDEEPVLGWRPAVGQAVPNTKWMLEEKLGEGGFGEVWVGRHQTMKERRVFKFCFRADRVRSLKREMTLFRLIKERIGDHPNIVSLREVYFDEPPFYVEMDYVAGQDLRRWCEAQGGVDKVPLEARLEIVAQVADALQAAHDAGVIHRDVKPGNILIANSGPRAPSSALRTPNLAVKLTDFGIGQVVSAEALAGVTQAGFTQTMLGPSSSSQTGTQLYMAPELLAGKPATTRSDIYSLGVVLYQLLIGDFKRAVTGDWTDEIQDPLLRDDLKHGLAGKPEQRFSGAAQLAKNLRDLGPRRTELARQQATVAEGIRLRRQAAQRRKAVLVSAGVIGLLFLLTVALAYGLRQAEQARKLQRLHTYAADIKAVQAELERDNLGSALGLLEAYVPRENEDDLRGVEWRYLWQQARGDELRTFRHPNTAPKDAVLSPDGRFLVTASYDDKIRVWDPATGSVLRELEGGGTVSMKKSLAFSPDGKRLFMRGRNGIEVRETTAWSVVNGLGSFNPASPIAASGDGRIVVGAVGDGISGRPWPEGFSLQAWNLETGGHRALSNAMAICYSLAVDAHGTRVAYSWAVPLFGGRGPLYVWDVERGLGVPIATNEDTTALAISPDDRWLASGHWGGEICLWDLASHQLLRRFRAHHGFIYGLAFAPDSGLLATGGSDQLIHLWPTGTTNRLRTLRGHASEIYRLAFSSDGQKLASASKDGTARVWSVESGPRHSHAFRPATKATPIGFLADGTGLVTVGTNPALAQVWRLPQGELLRSYSFAGTNGERFKTVQFFPRNGLAAGITSNGVVHLRDLATDTEMTPVALGDPSFVPDHLSPDRRWILGSSRQPGDWRLALYDLRKARRVPAFDFPTRFAYGAAFSPDSRWLAFSSPDAEESGQTVTLWDLTRHRPRQTLGRSRWPIIALVFSPDGELLAGGGWDDHIQLWELGTGKLLFRVPGHIPGVARLAFSPDGRTLASDGGDLAIRLWNVATGREMLRIQDAVMASGPPRGGYADSHLAGQAGLFPGDRWLAWQNLEGLLHVTALPTLAEIAASETQAQAGPTGARP